MPESHFLEYQRFYQEQPFGLWREDYRAAQTAHILAMVNSDPNKTAPQLRDFMPFFNAATTESEPDEFDDGVADYLAKR